MVLTPGTRLGPYEVTAQIGVGGMGEVYRATDTNLKRAVALKVLPDAVAGDAERLARFQREAEVLASLNHPNIAQIHGLEKSGGTTALVMELVEGPTLAERIAQVGRVPRSGPAGQSPGPRDAALDAAPGLRAAVGRVPTSLGDSTRGDRAGLPVDEALSIATQIASALEAAHELGIVHRDLKPANVKVRPDGVVKVLDFGLAKAMGPPEGGHYVQNGRSVRLQPDLTNAPTITSPAMMTGAGMILGTAAYMSPEQARGKTVDKRADIWAFGCVLYEMLSGRRAFDGEDVTEVLAFLITKEPDWSALPPATPAAIRSLLKGCLEKKSRERVADISTALFVLKDPTTLGDGPAEAGHYVRGALSGEGRSRPDVPLWRRAAVVGAAALCAGAVVATTVTWVAMRPAAPVPPRVSRFTIGPSGADALSISGNATDLAIAPDGSRVIYVGNNGARLFVRALDALEPVSVFTGVPRGPFMSPDGQWIGFVDGANLLKKVALTGGPAVTLATLDGTSRGGSWGRDDTIIFTTSNPATGLQQVAAAGGPVTVLTRPDRAQGEIRHLWPEVLPGGRAVLFTIVAVAGGPDAAQVAVLDLQTGMRKVLVRGGSHARYVQAGEGEGGYLVYAAAGTLRAVPFDLDTLETRGTPVPVVPDVVTTALGGVDAVAAGNGTLAYVSGAGVTAAQRTLVWVDRQGRETPIPAPPRAYVYPRLSPDGTRVAAEVRDQEWDIWIANLASTTLTRFSFGPASDRLPVWTPDGRRIVWSSERDGLANMYWQAADGSGPVERLLQSPNPQYSSAISPDGTRLVFREDTATRDLMLMPMDTTPPQPDPGGRGQPPEPRRAQPLIQTPFIEESAEISADGRWIAYQSDESGRDEVFVRPFPDVNAGRWQVSTGGGTKPLWARGGGELFYLVQGGAGAAVMSAPIERGASFAAGTPTKVLEGPYYFGTVGAGDAAFRTYDVAPDGRRFLMLKEGGGANQTAAPASLIVVLNWVEELKRLVPLAGSR